jgi:PAS domain S-box-containing protein
MKRLLLPISLSGLVVSTALASPVPDPRDANAWLSLGMDYSVRLVVVVAAVGLILYLRSLLGRRTSELRASEERFRRLFEDAVEGIYEIVPGGGFRLANPALARILGHASAAELMSLSADQVAKCYARPGRREEFLALLGQQNQVTNFESEVVRPDGTLIWVSENVRAVRNGAGGLLYVQGLVADVTARKRAEVAMRESESRYRRLFENSPIGFVECDCRPAIEWMEGLRAQGVTDLVAWAETHAEEMAREMRRLSIVGMNAAALRLAGAKSAEEAMASISRILLPDGWKLCQETFMAVWQGRHDFEGEMTLMALDGSRHHVHAHWCVPMVDGKPFYERTPIALLDLTQTMAAERELAAERERLAVTLSAMAEGVVTTDGNDVVRFINKAACMITGWTATSAIGRRIDEVCTLRHEKTGAAVLPPVATALAAGHVVNLPPQTVLLRRVGGRGFVEGCCAPIRDAGGRSTGTVLVLRDVTERSRLESELQRASKLEAVGILAGGIAHDFNNILAVVMGNLTLAQLDAGTGAAALRWLKEAERGALRARDLTQQLLTFAKGGDPVRTAVLLPEIVREAAKFALHGSTVRGEFDIANDLWAAEVDGGQIGQVVQNLVINATQAMPGGGTMRISLCNEELYEDAPAPLAAGRYLKLSLADSGTGIRPEHLARIFEPYFTTKEQGSGLGLATVYSIIRKHQGHVTVESEMGKGTTFNLWLPAAKQAPAAAAVSRSPFELLQGRILFMDDEEPIREMVNVLLGRLGLTVKTVADGSELLNEYVAARKNGQPYDLVMMDLTVPGAMGGREAMQELRKLDPAVRAIVSSGYSGDPVLANFREHGFCGIVPKPFRVTDLTKVLQAALAGR